MTPMWAILALTSALSIFLLTNGDITAGDCVSKFNGRMVGAQCFFIGKDKTNWTSAWTYCQYQHPNATLAQIHTSVEFNTVSELLLATRATEEPVRGWIALQRDASDPGQPCSITSTTTFWYDDPSTRNSRMPAGITYIRAHACEDGAWGAEFWMALMLNNASTVIGDQKIGGDYFGDGPACQISNCARSYTLQSLVCMIETPVESFPIMQAQECADACSQKKWCRSFNVIAGSAAGDCNSNRCELFTWVNSEPAPNAPAMMIGRMDCAHFDVDQS